jgi:hypothetical protein
MRAKTSPTAQPKPPQAGRSWPMPIIVRDDVPQSFAAGGAEFPSSPTFQISNRQFPARLETPVIRRKQTPDADSNRHFWEAWASNHAAFFEDAEAGNFLRFASSQISNRQWLARLENLSNSLKRKAGDDF